MRQLIVLKLQAEGWVFELTRKNHLKGTHPLASRPIWLPGTTGSKRNDVRIRALARRALAIDSVPTGAVTQEEGNQDG